MKPHPQDQRHWPGYRTARTVHELRKQGQVVIKLPVSKMVREDFLGLPKISAVGG